MNQQTAKTYRANDLASALASVRSELGPEALILSARQVRQGGLMGLGRASFEVRAVLPPKDEKKPKPKSDPNKMSQVRQTRRQLVEEVDRLQRTILQMREEVKAARMESIQHRDATDAIVCRLNHEMQTASTTLRGVLAEAHLYRRTGLPEAQVSVIRQLVDNGVEPGVAEATVRAAKQNSKDINSVRRAVAEFFLANLRTEPGLENTPGRCVVAFVGPTGVGKTTTIAKIAAACVVAGRRVGLVTTDTYRIAAVEQLKCYAELMDLKLIVASDPTTVRQAVDSFHRSHVVLVDTAGRSPQAKTEIERLTYLLSGAWIDQVHLVVPAGMNPSDIRNTYNAFRPVGISRLNWTKLDEAVQYGSLFNGQMITGKPINYLSAGQRVPEDLEAATPERVTRLLLKQTAVG